MNFSLINKICLFLISIIFLCSCNSTTVYEQFKIKKYDTPLIDEFDNQKISLDTNTYDFNYENKLFLKDFKNKNQYSINVDIDNNQIFALSNDFRLLSFSNETGELIFSKNINYKITKNDEIIFFNKFHKFYLIAFKSGSIIKIDIQGNIIWYFNSDKILNTALTIIEDQIIALYVDEIKSISLDNGAEIWSQIFEDIPVYQAQGGQLVNFANILYFILPNNKVGSFDYMLGSINRSNFDEIQLISSINNTKDKINIYKNYLIYLDEGKYLYTYDIILNEFILYKKNINISNSNIFLNNSIILKEGNYIQAINVFNGKTFWLINDDKISKSSNIVGIRNYNKNIEIFLNNGDVITINNKELIEIYNLDIGKIKNISFVKDNLIVHTKNDKVVIF